MTLNDQKEQFSIAYVRAVASVAAAKVSRVEVDDDSVDVTLERSGGCAPRLDLQLKCTGVDDHPAGVVTFPLKLKNYDDLRRRTLAPAGWWFCSCRRIPRTGWISNPPKHCCAITPAGPHWLGCRSRRTRHRKASRCPEQMFSLPMQSRVSWTKSKPPSASHESPDH